MSRRRMRSSYMLHEVMRWREFLRSMGKGYGAAEIADHSGYTLRQVEGVLARCGLLERVVDKSVDNVVDKVVKPLKELVVLDPFVLVPDYGSGTFTPVRRSVLGKQKQC